jgi:ABC-type glycerol-3-phosphate transport system permease component
MLSTGLECFRQRWNTFVQSWNAFYGVGIPLYRVGMLSTGLECSLQGFNAFYRVLMLSTGF